MDEQPPLIITAAITGSRTPKSKCPNLPVTPREIADSAVEAARAGAAVVHIHVRDTETGLGTQDERLYEETLGYIEASDQDPVICLTTSGIPGKNLSLDKRYIPLSFAPELASFDAGSLNLGDSVFHNPPEFLGELASRMKSSGTKPEFEIFDTGMVGNVLRLAEKGLFEHPLYFQFVLGAPGGAPATVSMLANMVAMLPPGSVWSAFGIGRSHMPVLLATLALGGNVRVGLEDNIYYGKNELALSNAQFVKRAGRLADEAGRAVATPAQAREILGVKK